jgi:hypothetical protein
MMHYIVQHLGVDVATTETCWCIQLKCIPLRAAGRKGLRWPQQKVVWGGGTLLMGGAMLYSWEEAPKKRLRNRPSSILVPKTEKLGS